MMMTGNFAGLAKAERSVAAMSDTVAGQDVLESEAAAPTNEVDALALESEVREALRHVVDPEINLDVITLGLIRHIVIDDRGVEVQMILTTPFCPYAGMMVQQVKDMTRLVVDNVLPGEVKVTLLDEVWSPELMDGGDWAEWGLL
jgi:metal-sulfur cluster biosynthetic enzyme